MILKQRRNHCNALGAVAAAKHNVIWADPYCWLAFNQQGSCHCFLYGDSMRGGMAPRMLKGDACWQILSEAQWSDNESPASGSFYFPAIRQGS